MREDIGTRFLADPNFQVMADGTKVTFQDVPAGKIRELEVEVAGVGVAKLVVMDAQKADRTTRQHGIAWWVDNRLVGRPGWIDFELDGRRNEAKRFQFIVRADFLAEAAATLPDWSGFDPRNPAWLAMREAVFASIREFLAGLTAERRGETKAAVRDSLSGVVARLTPISRDRWNDFVDAVVDTCPSVSADEIEQVAGILAKLEVADSKYGLIQQSRPKAGRPRLPAQPSNRLDGTHGQDRARRGAKPAEPDRGPGPSTNGARNGHPVDLEHVLP